MSQILIDKISGLYTQPNVLSEVPKGALTIAKNVVLDKDGNAETRRGFNRYAGEMGLSEGDTVDNYFNFKNSLLASYSGKLAYESGFTWHEYSGTYNKPANASKIRALEANRNFYFTTDKGVQKIAEVDGTIVDAGMYRGLDGTAELNGASGFLADQNQVAYRVVWGIYDSNKNLILGAPSQRIVIANNSGGSKDVEITFTIPNGITTSHFYQVYRSPLSGGVDIQPTDELGLVYENNPTAGEITDKEVVFIDSTPDALRGATLYTSPSQQGIQNSNDQPPLCTDIEQYKNMTLYSNTKTKQRFIVTLISVGGTSGVQVDDTITIGGITFTAKASENASSGEFKVFTSGSPAENINDTALSLIRVINKYASNTSFYAYYLSGFDELPGKILIEERILGGSAFALTSSRGSAYNPILPTSGESKSSDNEVAKNRVYFSKDGQPEAVPIYRYSDIGSADKDIYRVMALRDSVFVLKADGVFRITGETFETLSVALFDNTVILTAENSAVAFNNQIFCFTSQGIVSISDSGVGIVSRAIENELLRISAFSNFSSLSWALAYESDRKYIFFCPKFDNDTIASQQFVYNAITKAWSVWDLESSAGIVNSADDKIYYWKGGTNYTYQERKTFTISDYTDGEFDVSIVSYEGKVVTLSGYSAVKVGFTLKQSVLESLIKEDLGDGVFRVEDIQPWDIGSAKVYDPIEVEIQFVPQAANVGILKQFRDATVIFRQAIFRKLKVGFRTDLTGSLIETDLDIDGLLGWGGWPWGGGSWGGGGDPDLLAIRSYIPFVAQKGHFLIINIKHSNALNIFSIAGFSLQFNNMSERFKL